jgi:HEAT repeat protein
VTSMRAAVLLAVLGLTAVHSISSAADVRSTVTGTSLEQALASNDIAAIRAMGPAVLPHLVRLYETSDEGRRAAIASVFYGLGWKSEAAKDALMKDVRTPNQALRLQVQWALGRVSDDVAVVDVLLENMQHDANILFRDKAACALAHDQIHLRPAQKVHLFEGLIKAMDDPKPDVRRIAALVMQMQTHQDKGYRFADPPPVRARALEAWRRWLEEYRSQL